jgi:hypothetical protein
VVGSFHGTVDKYSQHKRLSVCYSNGGERIKFHGCYRVQGLQIAQTVDRGAGIARCCEQEQMVSSTLVILGKGVAISVPVAMIKQRTMSNERAPPGSEWLPSSHTLVVLRSPKHIVQTNHHQPFDLIRIFHCLSYHCWNRCSEIFLAVKLGHSTPLATLFS